MTDKPTLVHPTPIHWLYQFPDGRRDYSNREINGMRPIRAIGLFTEDEMKAYVDARVHHAIAWCAQKVSDRATVGRLAHEHFGVPEAYRQSLMLDKLAAEMLEGKA